MQHAWKLLLNTFMPFKSMHIQCKPMRSKKVCSLTFLYSSSVGNSIQASAKNLDSQKVGWTGPIRQASPPALVTL